MTNRQALITYSYHFLSEMLIVFLLFVPLLHLDEATVPLFPYIITSSAITILFALYTHLSTRFSPYVLSAPIIFSLFYYIQLPFYVIIFLTLFSIQRYIKIRSTKNKARENFYLRWALIFSIVAALIMDHIQLVLYILILFLVVMIGYMVRHFTVIEQNESKNRYQLFLIYVIIGLMIISMATYYMLPIVRKLLSMLWFLFVNVFIYTGSKVIQLLEWLQVFELEGKGEQHVQEGLGNVDQSQLTEPDQIDSVIFEWIVRIIIILLMIIGVSFILWKAYQLLRNRFSQVKGEHALTIVSYHSLNDQERSKFFARLYNRLRKRPDHPIRQLVYDIERKVSKTTLERFSYETVENWLQRLKLPGHLATYQKVRYGECDVTREEVKQLKSELASIEQLLKEKVKNIE